MKIRLTESELRNIVKKVVKETFEDGLKDRIESSTNSEYAKFSEARKALDRIERTTGWRTTSYQKTPDAFVFILGSNDESTGAQQVADFAQRLFGDKAEVKAGTNAVKVSVKLAYNRDYNRFANAASEKWKSDHPSEYPAGVPDKPVK